MDIFAHSVRIGKKILNNFKEFMCMILCPWIWNRLDGSLLEGTSVVVSLGVLFFLLWQNSFEYLTNISWIMNFFILAGKDRHYSHCPNSKLGKFYTYKKYFMSLRITSCALCSVYCFTHFNQVLVVLQEGKEAQD